MTQVQGNGSAKTPIGFAAGDANLYRYVGNGPTNSTDPSGLQEPEKYPTPFGPLTPRPNGLPRPSMHTQWKSRGQLLPWQSAHSSGDNWVRFQRSLSVSNYRNSGFSSKTANEAFSSGCFGLASFRLGRNGKMITPFSPGVSTFTNLPVAWEHLESEVASGRKSRLLILQSKFPPNLPPEHDPRQPIPPEFPVLLPASGETSGMHAKYDYATIHWDSSQNQYFWESQWNGPSDPNGGQHWRSAYPLANLEYTISMVVEISSEFEKCAQGLPAVPWKE